MRKITTGDDEIVVAGKIKVVAVRCDNTGVNVPRSNCGALGV